MLKYLKVLPALLLLAPAQARTLSEIKQSGTLLVTTNGPYEPFVYEKDGKLTGFEIELITAIAQQMGLKVDIQNVAFAPLLSNLNKDKQNIDVVIASHTITSTRLKEADWINHYCSADVLLSRVGGPKTSKELKGYKTGAELNSPQLGFLKKLPFDTQAQAFTSSDAAIKALIDGKIDATVTNKFTAKEIVKQNPKLQIGAVLWKSQKGIAVATGNKELKDTVAAALKALMKDGTYKKISEKYFGEDIRC